MGSGEVMSEARLAELLESFHECERLYDETNDYGKMNYGDVGFHRAKVIISALLADNERLRAREAALVAVAERVAASAGGRMLMCMCGIVGPNTRYDTPTWMSVGEPVHHAPDCVFAQAHALLASADGEMSGGDGQR